MIKVNNHQSQDDDFQTTKINTVRSDTGEGENRQLNPFFTSTIAYSMKQLNTVCLLRHRDNVEEIGLGSSMEIE